MSSKFSLDSLLKDRKKKEKLKRSYEELDEQLKSDAGTTGDADTELELPEEFASAVDEAFLDEVSSIDSNLIHFFYLKYCRSNMIMERKRLLCF
jgi:hypothetical protein